MNREGPLWIGRLARESGVGVETVRYYEREGLIAKPTRRGVRYRTYPPETVRRIRFIQRAKALGFTLREIRELLALRVRAGERCADVRERADAKLRVVQAKLAELEAMRDALDALVARCGVAHGAADCPFLDALDERGGDP